MSEISEHADNLISEYGKASQSCGGDWVEPWDERHVLEARQALENYIASFEAESAEMHEMVEQLIEMGNILEFLATDSPTCQTSKWRIFVNKWEKRKELK